MAPRTKTITRPAPLTLEDLEKAAQKPADIVLAPTEPPTPVDVLALAVQRGADMDQIERFMAAAKEWKAEMAREAFNTALAQFKARAIRVKRTTDRKEGPLQGQKYADLNAYNVASAEVLGEYGLSTSWSFPKTESRDWIEVTCIVRHKDGHSESTTFGGGVDTGPGRNPIQARKSTVTYLERITLQAALGLSDEGEDDDGAGGATLREERDEDLERNIEGWKDYLRECTTEAQVAERWKEVNATWNHQGLILRELREVADKHRAAIRAKTKGAPRHAA